MVTEISISENFLEEYLPRATIEILPPLPCDNFYLPDSGRHVTSVHKGCQLACSQVFKLCFFERILAYFSLGKGFGQGIVPVMPAEVAK